MGGAKADQSMQPGFKGPQKGGFMQSNDAEDFDANDWDKPKGGAAIGYKPSSGIGGGNMQRPSTQHGSGMRGLGQGLGAA